MNGEGFAFHVWKAYGKRCTVERCRICTRLWSRGRWARDLTAEVA